MTGANETVDAGDPYSLSRFVRAQEGDYARALSEIRAGRKQSHWIWYVFPQVEGLGWSQASRFYSLKSLAEAEAYLAHPVLGVRLLECFEAALGVEGRSAREIFGSPDDLKLRSSATLFACAAPPGSPVRSACDRALARFFHGEPDGQTLRLLGLTGDGSAARPGPHAP